MVEQRVHLLGKQGDVIGFVGKKAIHLMKPDEREKASKNEDLWIDIGVTKRAEAQALVRDNFTCQAHKVGLCDQP